MYSLIPMRDQLKQGGSLNSLGAERGGTRTGVGGAVTVHMVITPYQINETPSSTENNKHIAIKERYINSLVGQDTAQPTSITRVNVPLFLMPQLSVFGLFSAGPAWSTPYTRREM